MMVIMAQHLHKNHDGNYGITLTFKSHDGNNGITLTFKSHDGNNGII